jgi:hypothetical protein
MSDDDLLCRWEETWPACLPYAPVLKTVYADRWVRFHSLPESKRYPESEDEYAIVLSRYNTVLDELFAGQEVYVITPDWNDQPEPDQRPERHERWHPGAHYWTSICLESNPEFQSYWHLYVSRVRWRSGCFDTLLRAVADDETTGVMITDLATQRIHHPYDGGADVLLAPPGERDRLRPRHAGWLSAHQSGL